MPAPRADHGDCQLPEHHRAIAGRITPRSAAPHRLLARADLGDRIGLVRAFLGLGQQRLEDVLELLDALLREQPRSAPIAANPYGLDASTELPARKPARM